MTNETLSKIAGALLNAPVVPGVDVLLEPEDGPLVEAHKNGREPRDLTEERSALA